MPDFRFAVRVRPGSSRQRVGGAYGPDRVLIVAVNAQPVDGAANDAVQTAVAKAFGVRTRQVSIVHGHTGRSKVVSIEVAPDEDARVRARLEQLLGSTAAKSDVLPHLDSNQEPFD